MRRNRELFRNGLVELLTANVSWAVKEGTESKLRKMSDILSVKNYARQESVNSNSPTHGKKSDY